MNKIILIMSAVVLTSCTTPSYQYKDYAHHCVAKLNEDLPADVKEECLSLDTYEDYVHYHRTYSNEYRKMDDLDAAQAKFER